MTALEVTQADRDAAASIVRIGAPGLSNGNKVVASDIKGGLRDTYEVVQAFARHRIAALAALDATPGEGDADFLKDLARRLHKTGTPAMGFDQGDVDQLYRIARTIPAAPLSGSVVKP